MQTRRAILKKKCYSVDFKKSVIKYPVPEKYCMTRGIGGDDLDPYWAPMSHYLQTRD